MNYKSHYEKLIERARYRDKFSGYKELHHVVPRCLGGSDDSENVVALTPEEHFVAHQLLVKIHPKNPKLVYAALMMTTTSCFVPRRNKAYGWIRRLVSEHRKNAIGAKHSEASKRARSEKLKGKPLSEETKLKLKQAWIKRKIEKPMTQETKEKLRLAGLKRKHTPETKAKVSAARKGKPTRLKGVEHAA